MLVRLACIAVAHAFTALRLIPMSDHDKDVEILALRHQLAVLQRRLGNQRPGFQAADRAFLAALLAPLPQAALRRLRDASAKAASTPPIISGTTRQSRAHGEDRTPGRTCTHP
ncbi:MULTISPECIES: hypothetical protein [unclassified Streptomyces]|uniref:hypothetical protein n=1 Tax=unclassified Streptomyces TaxID=2593676 RepID=UPI0036E4E4C8